MHAVFVIKEVLPAKIETIIIAENEKTTEAVYLRINVENTDKVHADDFLVCELDDQEVPQKGYVLNKEGGEIQFLQEGERPKNYWALKDPHYSI